MSPGVVASPAPVVACGAGPAPVVACGAGTVAGVVGAAPGCTVAWAGAAFAGAVSVALSALAMSGMVLLNPAPYSLSLPELMLGMLACHGYEQLTKPSYTPRLSPAAPFASGHPPNLWQTA